MSFEVVITDAGRAEIINAENTGTGPVEITQIGFGSGQYLPASSQTALQNETKRISTISGEVVAADTIHVIVQDETQDEYDVGEFGLFTNSGTLLAVYSQPSGQGWIIEKSPTSTLLLAVDIILATIDAASLTFGDASFLNPPATESTPGVILRASESKALLGADDLSAMTPFLVRQAYLQYGIGARNQNVALPGDDIDAVRANGIYRFTTSTAGARPFPDIGQVIHAGQGQGFAIQIAGRTNTSTEIYVRRLSANVWTSWTRLFTGLDVVTEGDALAGNDNTKVMTPLRVRQAYEQYGLGTTEPQQLFSQAAIDAKIITGIYSVNGVATMPGGTFGHLIVISNAATRTTQTFRPLFSTTTAFTEFSRYSLDGGTTWSSWARNFQADDLPSLSEAQGTVVGDKPMTPLLTGRAFERLGYFGQYKSAQLLSSVGGDANDLTIRNGRYIGQSSADANLPAGATNGTLEHVMINDGGGSGFFGYQTYTNYLDNRLWVRTFSTATPRPWYEVFTDARIASQATAEAAENNTDIMTALRVFQSYSQYGLGQVSADLPIDDINDNTIPPGVGYRYDEATLGARPGSGIGNVWIAKINSNHAVQFALDFQTADLYTRTNETGTGWTLWRKMLNTGDISSQSQAEGGSDNTTVMTPLRVRQALLEQSIARAEFSGTRAVNGYQRIPADGQPDLIVQWGRVVNPGVDRLTVTFPITFPNAVRNIQVTQNSIDILNANTTAYNETTSQFTLLNDGGAQNYNSYWYAIGY